MSASSEFPGDPYEIPPSLYRNNRQRLCARFGELKEGILVFKGGSLQRVYDTDIELIFRQESTFDYLFGVTEPDCLGAVSLATGECTVFFPRPDDEHGLWFGASPSLAEKRATYQLDHAAYVEDFAAHLANEAGTVFTLDGAHCDGRRPCLQVAHTHGALQGRTIDDSNRLYSEVCAVRLIKSSEEVELMRWINKVASNAHVEVMKQMQPGWYEFQAEAVFKHYCAMRGCVSVAYTPICAAGSNGARLHYPHNNRKSLDGDMCLMDMGCEYRGYASDITTSFPVNGVFSQKQREVYEIVLTCFNAVHERARPGVSYLDMHMHSLHTLAGGLVKYGFVTCSVHEAIEKKIPSIFMPHGLGHHIGKDTHDVGGYARDQARPGTHEAQYLRTACVMEVGHMLTIEPGMYFIDAFLDKAVACPHIGPCLNQEKIASFRGFGGVRLESNVCVTGTGIDCLTVVPRTVADVEAAMCTRVSR